MRARIYVSSLLATLIGSLDSNYRDDCVPILLILAADFSSFLSFFRGKKPLFFDDLWELFRISA